MSIKHLRTLVAISDHKSFVAAARRVNVTLSAVSMQMKALEEELDVALFDRSHRPPTLTSAAARLVDPARELIARYDALTRLAQADTPLSGRLLLGVISTATIRLMPKALELIARDYPTAQVRIETALTDDLLENVRNGSFDAALVTRPREAIAGIRMTTVYREKLVLIARHDISRPPTLEHLHGAPFIRFVRRTGIGRIIDSLLVSQNIQPDEIMEIDTLEGILSMVANGLGISIVPESCISPELMDQYVVAACGEAPVFRDVAFVTRDRVETAALHQALLEILVKSNTQSMTG